MLIKCTPIAGVYKANYETADHVNRIPGTINSYLFPASCQAELKAQHSRNIHNAAEF
jgi:hypothetical protein